MAVVELKREPSILRMQPPHDPYFLDIMKRLEEERRQARVQRYMKRRISGISSVSEIQRANMRKGVSELGGK